MSGKIKVLNISNYYKPHIGGIEQVAHDISDSLLDNYEQKVICFNSEKETRVDVVDGVEVTYVGTFAKVASQSLSLHYGKELNKIMKEFKPDIVIFHYPNPFVASKLVKYLKNKTFKFILWWHLDIIKQKVLKVLFEGQNKKLLKYADKIVATSPNYIEGSKYLLANKEKCAVIPNCVNEKRLEYNDENINAANKIKEKYKNKNILFAFGRHVEYKGLEYLVKSSKLLSDDYVVLIGGCGPLTDDLKKLATGDSKIEFLGKISDDELKAYLLACDLFCFPSITKNEAFGIGLAEAMYYGKPSVTFTIPGSGVNYVSVNEETGLEVENMNVSMYADAIKKISSDPDLKEKFGNNAQERVKNNFLFETFKDNVYNLISK